MDIVYYAVINIIGGIIEIATLNSNAEDALAHFSNATRIVQVDKEAYAAASNGAELRITTPRGDGFFNVEALPHGEVVERVTPSPWG